MALTLSPASLPPSPTHHQALMFQFLNNIDYSAILWPELVCFGPATDQFGPVLDLNGSQTGLPPELSKRTPLDPIRTPLLTFKLIRTAIKWADSSSPRFRCRSVCVVQTFKQTFCGLRRSPLRTQKSAADLLQIRFKYAVERWTNFSK